MEWGAEDGRLAEMVNAVDHSGDDLRRTVRKLAAWFKSASVPHVPEQSKLDRLWQHEVAETRAVTQMQNIDLSPNWSKSGRWKTSLDGAKTRCS